jgi:very-short-patch-repair endonuclease
MPKAPRPHGPQLRADLVAAARRMRHDPTRAEDVLWERLRGRQVADAKFRRQHTIDRFVVDFYCAEACLVIEVDGPVHQETQEQDAERQAILESLGLRVIRFKNDEVLTDVGSVVKRISEELQG